MKKIICFSSCLSLFIFLMGCSSKQDELSSEWNLVFEDEFDDLDAWNVWYGGAFNEEIQLYRAEQLSLENGLLIISAEREAINGPITPFDGGDKSFEYVSGRIESKAFYGPSEKDGESSFRFQARIKLPKGKGMWPAFWTYGDPWPTHGEIDILEARGTEVHKFQSNIFYGPEPSVSINFDSEAFFEFEEDLTQEFHIYEMIWDKDRIEIWFDGQRLHRYTADEKNNISALFGKKEKIVFNLAVGGWFIEDRNSMNFADKAEMQVDWVRVFKK